jgi:hypothetical protein
MVTAVCVWKLPDLWTHRTRPQVFAKPQTVSHSSHTPSPVPFSDKIKDQNFSRFSVQRPTDSAEEADIDVLRARYIEELRPKLGRPEREDLALKLWIEIIEETRQRRQG